MFLLLRLIVIVLAFISYEQKTVAQYVPPYTSIVFPVTKHTDAAKPLYSIQIMTSYVNMQYMGENFLIDIDAPLTWHNCTLQWNANPGNCPPNTLPPVSCEEYQCTDVRTAYSYPSCPPQTNGSTLPGWGYCTCPVNVVCPVTGTCDQAMLNYDEFMVVTSDGRNVLDGFSGYYPNAACAPSSSFASFPANVTGVMTFSTSLYAFPQNSFQPVKRILSLCFPSSKSARGVLFFGTGPYFFRPQTRVDVRSYLSYTPLLTLTHPDSFGYYIGVNAIVIKKRSIVVPTNTTTKLSTIDPYTILRTDIYNRVVQTFSTATMGIPRAKSVAPFSLCFRNVNLGTRVGFKVPDISFRMRNGENWVISMANSIKRITNDVGCLAFVDGGATSEPAIVIGTFQFEDNFLEFNLENSTFGFSSSLLRKQTSCANFNFTTIS